MKGGTAFALAGLAKGNEPAAAGWNPRLALSSVMFSELKLEAFFKLASSLGFSLVDLWAPFGECRHLAEAKELGAGGFRKLLDSHKLEVGAWTAYRAQGHHEGFPVYADFIASCGGGVLVRESKYGNVDEGDLEVEIKTFFKELEPEIRLARKHGVKLAIENHSSALLNSLPSLRLFAKLNPDPRVVGIALAPYHLQAISAPVVEAIRICGDQLRFVYAWQKAQHTGQLPGIGPTDFSPWMKALAESKYGGPISPFMHGTLPAPEMAAAVTKAKKYLESRTVLPGKPPTH